MDGWKPLEFWHARRTLASLALCLLALLGPLRAQENDFGPAPGEVSGFESRLNKLWQRYLDACQSGDRSAADSAVAEIRAASDASAEIFELGSYLFLEQGIAAAKRGDAEQARKDFHNAIDLNPFLWPAYEELGKLKDPVNRLRLSLKGMSNSLDSTNAWLFLDFLDWVLTLLQRILMVLVIVFAVILCGKYARQFYASSLNAFEERHIHGFYAKLLSILIFCLPFLLGFNIYLVACAYLVLFFPLFDGRERLASLVAAATILALPVLAHYSANVQWARVNPALHAHLSQFVRGNLTEHLAAFEKNSTDSASRDLTTLIIGLMEKSNGDLRKGLATFEAIKPPSAWTDHALINSGNIRFMAREYQDAMEAYKRVGESSPVYALALYNLSLVMSKQGFHDEAESLRRKAIGRDPKLAIRSNKEGSSHALDALPDYHKLLWEAILKPDERKGAFVQTLLPYLGLFAALCLFALFHARSRNARLFTKSCDKCGRLYLQSDSPESEWCSQCVTLYMKKDDLPSEAKMRKHDEVARFGRRRRRIIGLLQLLAPGSKKLVTGNALNGLFTLGLWLSLLHFCIVPINSVSHFSMRFLDTPVILTWILIFITAVFWLIFGLRPIVKET